MDKLQWGLITLPTWLLVGQYLVGIAIVWIAYKSRPYWVKGEKLVNAQAQAHLPAIVAKQIAAGIDWAEENFYGLTGPQRMTRCIAYLGRIGVIVSEEQVQAVYDVAKKLGAFEKPAPKEAA